MEGQKVWVWGPVPCGKSLPLSALSFCISEMTESLPSTCSETEVSHSQTATLCSWSLGPPGPGLLQTLCQHGIQVGARWALEMGHFYHPQIE